MHWTSFVRWGRAVLLKRPNVKRAVKRTDWVGMSRRIVMLSIMLRDADPVGSDRSDRIDRIGYGSGGEGEQNASRYQILVGW